jgi:hypothetical protein
MEQVFYSQHKAELAAFLGTDFNKPICGTGANSVKRMMDHYIKLPTEAQ